MQIEKKQNSSKKYYLMTAFVTGSLFIMVGLLIMFRNLGYVDRYVFNAIVSWQSLVIALGVWSLLRKHYASGTFMVVVGSFFLIPIIIGAGSAWIHTYWPFLLIALGIWMIVFYLLPGRQRRHNHHDRRFAVDSDYNNNNGFITAINDFGNLKQIAPNGVFRGAKIRNYLGAIVLDLRYCTLEPGHTTIDLESAFGGVEIYVPSDCALVVELETSLAGIDDKRMIKKIHQDATLIIKGKVRFSGLEIKS